MKTNDAYIEELASIGANFYPLEEYKGSHVALKHKCFNDHEWLCKPANALRGNGCPECGKVGNQPVKLYHVSFKYNGIVYYKLGITNQALYRRFRDKWKELEMESIWEQMYSSRFLAKAHEQMLLHENIDNLINLNVFNELGGDTETLLNPVDNPKENC